MNKMVCYGVRGFQLEWIKQFLSNRTHSVILENHKSDPLDVVSRVPHCTVMGPLLFLAFINDLLCRSYNIKRTTVDWWLSTLPLHYRKTEDADLLQKGLKLLENGKSICKFVFTRKNVHWVIRVSGRRQLHQTSSHTLHGHTLETTESGKYLWLTINKDLTWINHISTRP